MDQELLEALQEGTESAVKLINQLGPKDLAENAFSFLKISTGRAGAEAVTEVILNKATVTTLRSLLHLAGKEKNEALFDKIFPKGILPLKSV